MILSGVFIRLVILCYLILSGALFSSDLLMGSGVCILSGFFLVFYPVCLRADDSFYPVLNRTPSGVGGCRRFHGLVAYGMTEYVF